MRFNLYILSLWLISGTATASLVDRGGGMLYDTTLNITWLQDANYARTGGFDADGKMTWDTAKSWADNLSYGGYSDWRLPTTIDLAPQGCNSENFGGIGTDCGYNPDPNSSELAHMFFANLQLKGEFDLNGNYQSDSGIFGNGTFNGADKTSFGQNDVGLVNNLQSSAYWSNTDYPPNILNAWYFSNTNGYQDIHSKSNEHFAWAVRSGDVNPVPVPTTFSFLISGLVVLVSFKRRKSKAD